MTAFIRQTALGFAMALSFVLAQASAAIGADPEQVETFLEVTGFDVALEH